jgi:hypothetical protein
MSRIHVVWRDAQCKTSAKIPQRQIIVLIAATLVILLTAIGLLAQPERRSAENTSSLSQPAAQSATACAAPTATPEPALRIGTWIVPKWLLALIFPLLGTVIGGLITYVSTVAVERRRRRKEQQDKERQESIAAIKKTVIYIDKIVTDMKSLQSDFQKLSDDPGAFTQPFFDAVRQIRDPPESQADLRLSLAPGLYDNIVQEWQHVRAIRSMVNEFYGNPNRDIATASKEFKPKIGELTTHLSKLEDYRKGLDCDYRKLTAGPKVMQFLAWIGIRRGNQTNI